jgi:hypothetical protein
LLAVDCGGAFGRHLISDFQDSGVGRLLLINTRNSHSRAPVQLIPNVNTNGITSVRSIAPQIDIISPLTALATPFRVSADAKRDFLNLVAHFSATGVLQESARTRNFPRPLPFSIPTFVDLGARIAHSDPPAILIFHSLLIELFNLEKSLHSLKMKGEPRILFPQS